ncbi:MAG: hypothetical protein ABEK50_10660, partial [bacterium]
VAVPGSAGIRYAGRALAGDRGYRDILECDGGFLDTYCYVPLPEMMGGFGETWVTRTVAFKPAPGCAYLQSPLQAYRELRDEHGFSGQEVESVTVDAPLMTLLMESHSSPFWEESQLTPVNVTFSVALSLGVMLIEDDFGVDYLEKSYLESNSDAIREAAQSVTLNHSWDHTFQVMEGVTAGMDTGPLVEKHGYWSILNGLRSMREHHQGLSTSKELFSLITSGQFGKIMKLFDSPLDWETFDIGRAELDEFKFNFGASVTVELESEGELTRDLKGHRGRSEEKSARQKPIVEGKLWEQADAHYPSSRAEKLISSIQDLPETKLNQIVDVLFE